MAGQRKEVIDTRNKQPTANKDTLQDIPPTFYARVLNAHTASPAILRASAVRTIILQQMLLHFDPIHQGLAIILIQCVQPLPGHKVRSLRTVTGRGTRPWASYVEHKTQFVGAGTQAGQTVLLGRYLVVQSYETKLLAFPTKRINVLEESVITYPILLSGRVAGCVCIASTQKNFFSQARLNLVQAYTDLLVLVFEQDDFYDLRAIDLGVIPGYERQQPYLRDFQSRVRYRMLQAAQNKQSLTWPRAETLVWQDIEEELLQLPPETETRS